MKKLIFNLACAVCLVAASSAFANVSVAESKSFRLVTSSTIASRTVEGDSVYIAALDGYEGVPMVDGVAISGWSSANPYWNTTSVTNGAHVLTYGGKSVRLIVENATGKAMNESESFCLELRSDDEGRTVQGTVRIAPSSKSTSVPTIDGVALSGWSSDAPLWDSTTVADGWHTFALDSQSVELLVFNVSIYMLVNGKKVIAEPGKTLQLDPHDYIPNGNTFTGWSVPSGFVVSFDNTTGKISITLPSDATQPTITIDSTAYPLNNAHINWSIQLNKGWNLISTGIYKLDDVSLKKLMALTPQVYENGRYTPMTEYLPAHAYWVHSDEEQTIELSGFTTK